MIITTWALKKKESDTCRAKVNARRFMQIYGEHYYS